MNPSDVFPNDLPAFENRAAEELIIDGPEDNTVRPCRPELLKYLQAQRDLLDRWSHEDRSDSGG